MKNVGNSSRGRSQGVPKVFRAPIYRAHCAVIFAIARLSCYYNYRRNQHKYKSLKNPNKKTFVNVNKKRYPFQSIGPTSKESKKRVTFFITLTHVFFIFFWIKTFFTNVYYTYGCGCSYLGEVKK